VISVRRAVLLTITVLAGCSDVGPSSGPGTLTATLRSPNGDEGAAVIFLLGEGVIEVNAVGETEAYADTSGETTRIVLINREGGTMSVAVDVEDLGRPLVALVREVAGPDDLLRADLAGYRVEVVQ